MPTTTPYSPLPGPYLGPTVGAPPKVPQAAIPEPVPSSGNAITNAGTNSNANVTTSNLVSNANLAISNLSFGANTVYNVTLAAAGPNSSIQYNNNGQFAGSGTFRYISSINAPGVTASVYNNGFGGLTGCAPIYFYNPNTGGGNVGQGMISWFTGIANSSVGGTGVHISPWPNYGNNPVRNDAGITVYRGPSGVFYRTVTNINASQTGPGPHGLNLFDGSMYVNSYDRGSGNTSGVSQIILNAPYSSGRAIGQISSFAYTSPDQGRMWTLGWRQGSASSPNRAQEETPGNINISWNSNNRVGINGANLTESFNVKGNIRIQATGANSDTGILFADGTFQYTAATGSLLTVQEEGTNVLTSANTINFVGSGVTASNVSGVATITVPGGITGVAVQEEGTNVVSSANTINFVGSGVTASNVGNVATITISSEGISGIAVQEEGTNVLASANTINFVGSSVTASNVGNVATITISSGLAVQEEGTNVVASANTINFVGSGVTASNVSGVATVTISGGGNGTPGGSNTYIQFNDEGSFGGNGYFTFNKSTRLMYLVGNADIVYNLSVSGVSNLNSVNNVIITGGSNGQVLTTNGSGNLSWTTVSGGSGDTVYNKGNVSGTTIISISDGTIQTCTMTGDTYFDLSSITSSKSITLLLTQGSGGSKLATYSSTVLWAAGYKTLSTTASAVDMVNLVNIGGTFYGTLTTGYAA